MSVRTNVATTGLSTELFSFCAELNRASVHEANYWWHDNYQGRYVFKLMITLFSVVFFSSVIISFVQLWTCTCHAHLALSLVYEMDMRFMNRNRSCNFKCVFDSYIKLSYILYDNNGSTTFVWWLSKLYWFSKICQNVICICINMIPMRLRSTHHLVPQYCSVLGKLENLIFFDIEKISKIVI
jgi:hypothetical protein